MVRVHRGPGTGCPARRAAGAARSGLKEPLLSGLLPGQLGDPATIGIERSSLGDARGEPVSGDRVIRLATAAVVCAVAAFAAVVSYGLSRRRVSQVIAQVTGSGNGHRPEGEAA